MSRHPLFLVIRTVYTCAGKLLMLTTILDAYVGVRCTNFYPVWLQTISKGKTKEKRKNIWRARLEASIPRSFQALRRLGVHRLYFTRCSLNTTLSTGVACYGILAISFRACTLHSFYRCHAFFVDAKSSFCSIVDFKPVMKAHCFKKAQVYAQSPSLNGYVSRVQWYKVGTSSRVVYVPSVASQGRWYCCQIPHFKWMHVKFYVIKLVSFCSQYLDSVQWSVPDSHTYYIVWCFGLTLMILCILICCERVVVRFDVSFSWQVL